MRLFREEKGVSLLELVLSILLLGIMGLAFSELLVHFRKSGRTNETLQDIGSLKGYLVGILGRSAPCILAAGDGTINPYQMMLSTAGVLQPTPLNLYNTSGPGIRFYSNNPTGNQNIFGSLRITNILLTPVNNTGMTVGSTVLNILQVTMAPTGVDRVYGPPTYTVSLPMTTRLDASYNITYCSSRDPGAAFPVQPVQCTAGQTTVLNGNGQWSCVAALGQ